MTEVLEKTTTGLPELPEGYFWRVGKLEKYIYDHFSGDNVKIELEGVGIVKRTTTVKRTEHPVYGEKWYNGWKKVGTRWEEITVVDDTLVNYLKFDERFERFDTEEVPPYARDVYATGGGTNRYSITIDEAGITFLAGRVFKYWSEREEAIRAERERKSIEKANKERLYGDYPPKTLVSA